MKKLVALLLVSMMASVAFAGLDPDTDSFGVYFDQAGMSNCATIPMFTPTPVYLLLMNPASATNGFECTINIVGPHLLGGTALGGIGPVNVGSGNAFAVGCAGNYPVVGGASVLVTWTFLVAGAGEIQFFVTQAASPSLPGGLPVLTGDGVLRRGGVASGDVALPVAAINGGCPVSEEVSSFGHVKSLFR